MQAILKKDEDKRSIEQQDKLKEKIKNDILNIKIKKCMATHLHSIF